MKALVVHESMFGNTSAIAEAVAETLRREGLEVRSADVSEVSPDVADEYDLLVLGAPTHAFSLSRPRTRADAVARGGAATAEEVGLREWIEALPAAGGRTVRVAVFDTRVAKVARLPKSAATRAFTLLRRKGYRLLDRPIGFVVDDVAGPLLPGEQARASTWIDGLVAELRAGPSTLPSQRTEGSGR